MKNFILLFFFTLSGCGVNTDSSQNNLVVLINNLEINSSENNVTQILDENSTQDINKSNTSIDTFLDSSNNALYDQYACDSTQVSAPLLQHSSVSDKEEKFDIINGIKVKSLYPSEFGEVNSTVTLYYNKFPSSGSLKDDRTIFFGDDPIYGSAIYTVAYDLAWLNVADSFIYIKLPQLDNNKSSCYRLLLDQEQGTDATAQKVYR